jgi:hypothetical protein
MNDLIDLRELQLERGELLGYQETSTARSVKSKRTHFFLGNIPLEWLHGAARTPGRGLHLALAIWHLKSLRRSDCIRLSGKVAREFGVERGPMYRALVSLEQAGLISVVRAPGRSPQITVLAPEITLKSNLRRADDLQRCATGPPSSLLERLGKISVT